jgi:dTDP-4-amino-4,6-dideoxygalactose transaminase
VNHGRSGHSTHTVLGYNYRLTNIAAAIGLVQLRKLDEWSALRRRNAAFLNKHLGGLAFITVPGIPKNCEPVFHQYTIRIKASLRDRFMKHLASKSIGCGIYYPTAIYRQPVYSELGYRRGLCPEAERAAEEVVSLPVHPSLKQEELLKIVAAVEEFGKEL